MKKFILAILIVSMIFTILACGNKETTKVDTGENTNNEQNIVEKEPDEELENITIETDFQDIIDGKRKVVIHVTNESDKEFNGNLSVKLKTISGQDAGTDIVYVDNLAPGSKTYAIIEGDKDADNAECKTSGEFTEYEGYVSKYGYEIIHTEPGNSYQTLYIKPESVTQDVLIDIIKEFRFKYTEDNMVGFQIFFFDVEQEGEPDIDNAIADYACNYNSGLSELAIGDGEVIEME